MNHERQEKYEIGFDNLIGLFEKTQTTMQMQAARSVDIALVVCNWLFGWYIVEFENGGAERAELYGKNLINSLSKRLSQLKIKGMSPTNLRKIRGFYQAYEKIQQTVSVKSNKSTLPKDSNIHASEYQFYLPSKNELKKQLEEAQQEWEAHHGK